MSYVGVPPFGQTVRTVTEVTAVQDQVTFYPTGGYLPGYIDIELDGSDLGSQDFTATDGLSVVLTQKAGAGSLFRSKAYWPVSLVDTYRKSEIDAKFLPITGGTLTGALNEAQGADIASASTINLTAATGNYVNVTGTTSITAITLAQGAERTVKFAGALTLTNGASLILPSGANITTAAGDVAVFRGEAAGVVRCVSYMKANGQAVSAPTLATVATTGSYTDLTNKPTIGTGTVTSITAGAGLTGGTITGTGTVALDVSLGGIGSIFIGISTSYYNSTATYRSVGSVTVAGSTLRQGNQGVLGGIITTSTAQVAPGFGGTWRNDTQFYQFPACCGSPGGAGQSVWRRIA